MPRNVYFSQGVRSEQNVLEDIIIESLKIYGHDMYYLPRNIVKIDKILNEDVVSKFGEAFKLEAYIESLDGYGGDGTLMSKFGLQIRDQMTLIISRKRWQQLVGRFKVGNTLPRPGEGDLIYFPTDHVLMEIKFVEYRSPFFQLKNVPTYKLTCEMFEYSGEDLNTGITEIDSLQLSKSNQIGLTLSSSTGQFSVGETITCTVNGHSVTAEVVSHNGNLLTVVNIKTNDSQFHHIVGTISGVTSASSAVVSSSEDIIAMEAADPSAQNASFESLGDDLIDFSEINPFGEANYQT